MTKIVRQYEWYFDHQKFGRDLQLWRKTNKLTQQDVADMVQCHSTAISTFETGRYKPDFQYPSMTLFLAIVTAMDNDPRDYWRLQSTHLTYPEF